MPVKEFLVARPKASLLLSLLLLGVAILIVFWPATHNGLVWDDHITFEQAATYKHLTLLGMEKALLQPLIYSENYFRPLPVLSFMVQMKWFGLDAQGFHLVSIVIHILNTMVLSLLVWTVAADTGPVSKNFYAVLGGLVYGIHPALVEPVVFISSRFDLLTTFFLGSALLVDQLKPRPGIRIASIALLFLCAALSKEMALALPLCLPFLHIATLKNRPASVMEIFRHLWRNGYGYTYLAIIAGGLVYLLLRYEVLGYVLHLGSVDRTDIGSTISHIALIGKSLAEYFLLIFLPFGHLSAVHSVSLPVIPTDLSAWVGLVILASTIALTVALHLRGKFNPGWALLAIGASLFPILNVVPNNRPPDAFFAESFLVFPIFVAVFLLIITWSQARNRFTNSATGSLNRIMPVLPVCWIVLSVLSVSTTIPLWKSDVTLWGYALYKENKPNLLAITNYTGGLVENGQMEQAREVARKAVNDFPGSAYLWHLYAIALSQTGDYTKAVSADEKAIQINPGTPHYYVSLGYSYYSLDRIPEAKKAYLKALTIDKDFVPALRSLAYLSEKVGDYNAADRYMRHAILMTTIVAQKQELKAWLDEAKTRRKMSK